MKILIVEDEPKTGEYLKQGLTEAGFVTDLARDGWDGLELAKEGHYDLMILDVMLPGLNGWQVLEGVRRAVRAGRKIELTAKEFALLELFLRRQGEVLPRSLIASQVWDMNFDSDTNVIDVAVRRLRVKIDDGFEFKLIHTVRGMGYVLEADPEGSAP